MNADNIIVMSHGRVVEHGTHDDLYARDGMYRGLVDAQRISAEGADGYVTPEEEESTNRIASSPGEEIFSPLRKSSTRYSAMSKNSNAGVVAKTEYPLFYLAKTVRSRGID